MNIHIKQISSNKPDLVLLHGWGTSSDIWQPWLVSLSDNFSITCIDLPGLGKSESAASEMLVDNVLLALEPLIPDNSILLGWSLGGLLSTLLAQRIENKLKALITIAYNPCFVQKDDWQAAMPAEVFQQFSNDLSQNEQKTLSKFFMLQVKGGSQSKSILKQLKGINELQNHSQLLPSLEWLKIDSTLQLQNLKIPSLHIYGEMDYLAPAALCDKLLGLSKKIKVCIVPSAGHLPFLSDVDVVESEILAFTGSIENSEL